MGKQATPTAALAPSFEPPFKLELSYLLGQEGLPLADVVVLRHRPSEPRLQKVFPWLVEERPEVFRLYQSIQGGRAAGALRRARYVAAFVGLVSGQATFAGLYQIRGSEPVTEDAVRAVPGAAELEAYGLESLAREGDVRFELEPLERWSNWIGRLTIDWPAPELSWVRRAERNDFPVRAIAQESQFVRTVPGWQELILGWDELKVMPAGWKASLSQWRGVYFIFDTAREKGYVGSASGADNILGRWMSYAQSGHGGNVMLRDSRAEDLRFSILQRTSPDMLRPEIEALERSWKKRLHVREHGLCAN